jgi:cyclopropane fatty-acyl-phospholipid synthase-like methyltransferase
MKPYSESCDQNREPILEVIGPLFMEKQQILEIGSGTGQHAVYFARKMPHLTWHTSDRVENHSGIRAWLADAVLSNTREPIELDVGSSEWPIIGVDAVFSANTVHIMHWEDVVALFQGVGRLLESGGLFCLYGPFNYAGRYTSESNARFDSWLKERDCLSGIRDFDDLSRLADDAGMTFKKDFEMPANNRILCWRKN